MLEFVAQTDFCVHIIIFFIDGEFAINGFLPKFLSLL